MLKIKKKDVLICILIFLILLVLRIPKTPLPGVDAFKLIWEAQNIIAGNWQAWLIHPLSIIGAYPYSGYPIGSVLCLSFFMLIANSNIVISVYLFTFTFTILSIITFYILSKYLFNNRYLAFFSTLIFETAPIYSEFSLNASARLPFMAIYPLIFLTILKFLRTRKIRFLLLNLFLTIISMFFHRMGMILFVLTLSVIIIVVFEKLIKSLISRDKFTEKITKINKKFYFYLGIFNSFILITTLLLFHNQSWWANKNPNILVTNISIIDTGFTTILDYVFAFGPLLLITLITPYIIDSSNNPIFKDKAVKIFLLSQSIFLPMIGAVAYTRFFLLPLYAIFTTFGLARINEMKRSKIFLGFISLLSIVLIFAYTFLWRSIPVYSYIALAVFICILGFILILYLQNIKKIKLFSGKTIKVSIIGLLMLSVMLSSSFIVDSKIVFSNTEEEEWIIFYEEESEIITFLEAQEKGVITSYYDLLERRIATFTNNLHLKSPTFLLESGYYTSEQIIMASQLKSLTNWNEPYIYSNSLPNHNYFHRLLYECQDYSNATFLVESLNISYIILMKNFTYYYIYGNFYFSSFISNISYPVIFETEHYNVHYTE